MSFFRKKSGLEIPPVADNNSSRGGGGGRSVSPQPPSYRESASSSYNVSRDGDPYSNARPSYRDEKRHEPYGGNDSGNGPRAPGAVPERYGNRAAIGDPYSRGGSADADRAQLFSGFNPEKRPAGPNRFDDRGGGPSGGRFGGAGEDDEPKQFQTQEDEDEEVEGIKQQTKWVKQESVASTRNALRIAREAEETGRNTLSRLGDQSEKLANTERYIDQGKLHALRAEDKTDELKKLNRSIFRPAITFNKDSKRAAQEAKVAARYDEERAERERAMGDVRESQNRLGRAAGYSAHENAGGDDEFGNDERIRRPGRSPAVQAARQESRKRYQFEKTASDDELEDELDDNLDEISKATKGLKAIALAAGEELDRQNQRIDEISQKTGKLNNRVDITTNRLKRIK